MGGVTRAQVHRAELAWLAAWLWLSVIAIVGARYHLWKVLFSFLY